MSRYTKRSRRTMGVLLWIFALVFLGLALWNRPKGPGQETGPVPEIGELESKNAGALVGISSRLAASEASRPGTAVGLQFTKYSQGVEGKYLPEGAGESVEAELSLVSRACLQSWDEPGPETDGARLVTPLYALVFQCVVPKSSGLRSMGELAGRRVTVGLRGSEGEWLNRQALATQGLDYGDIIPLYLDLPQAIEALEQGEADAILLHSVLPNQALANLSANTDLTLLPIEGNHLIDHVEAELPGYEVVVIPSNIYKGVEGIRLSVATDVLLVADQGVDYRLVYHLSQTLYENMGELKALFPVDREFRRSSFNNRYPVPLHPGAEDYFIEQGLMLE